MRIKKIKFIPQRDQMDCGPACLSMVASIYGKSYPLEYLRDLSYITREGVSLLGLIDAGAKIGLSSSSYKLELDELIEIAKNNVCILHWDQNHFVVLYRVRKYKTNKYLFYIANPAFGKIKLSEEKFKEGWLADTYSGICMVLHPTSEFFKKEPPKSDSFNIRYLLKFIQPHKSKLALLILLLLIGSLVTFTLPFLTQALIDRGVIQKNTKIVATILLAQLSLYLGSMVAEFFRNWLILHIGTIISVDIISNFLNKMLKLPISFFETKLTGDFQQRIQDNNRIEEFLTSQSLTTFFSILIFLVFYGVLWYYDLRILIIYSSLTTISIIWSLFWLKKEKN